MSSGKILVVENSDAVRDLFETFFKKKGFEVALAAHGSDGIDLARREKPGVALVGARLSDMDGLEVIRRMRRENESMKIFLLSGISLEEIEWQAMSEGATACLRKTSSLEEIFNMIKSDL